MAEDQQIAKNINKVNNHLVVAIGASAGGLQAFESFLTELPVNFDFIVIFIQHLLSTHKSLMPDILSNQRPDLEFVEISEGLAFLPGKIYMCPVSTAVTVQDGTFSLLTLVKEREHFPIDESFVSLADCVDDGLIGVILSGAGTDGVRGIQAMKESGGIVLAQEPSTAEFSGMPIAAISTGLVDRILSPSEIASQILKIGSSNMESLIEGTLIGDASFEPIFRLLYERTGNIFNHYKKNVVARRIKRRMNLNGISSTNAYLEILAAKSSEAEMLASDLMIGVTSFFRDRIVWKILESDVIRQFAMTHDDGPVRIWIPACATGEEAYSIAMLMQEELDRTGRKLEVQIFASDINERALELARTGKYPGSVTVNIPSEFLKKFCMQSADGQRVAINSALRQRVVFARHDILNDPPFSRMDLIICRNVLIYFEPQAQDKCISLFHYALKDGGYLFLGNAESVGNNRALFETAGHKKNCIYKRIKGDTHLKRPMLGPFSTRQVERGNLQLNISEQGRSITELAQRALIDECDMSAVAINTNYEILYFSGPMNRYLRNPEGAPTQNILDLLPENLRGRIRGSLYRVIHGEKPVTVRVTLIDNAGRTKNLTLRLLKVKENLFLVTFREKKGLQKSEEAPLDLSPLNETAVHQLETELCATRDDLQSHIQQLESLSEELQSSNEELQASNEEMVTSREELQSLNEELLTVNAQLQANIAEKEETNNDLNNFIASADIPTLFLSRSLKIRRFSPAMSKVIPLLPADVGRPVVDMSLDRLGPYLIDDITEVLGSLKPVKKEMSLESVWYVRSVLPYKTADNRVEGAVITYADVTELKRAEEQTRHLASFPQLNPNPVLEVNSDGNIVFSNQATRNILETLGMDKDNATAFFPADMESILMSLKRNEEISLYREAIVKDRVFGETIHIAPQFGVVRIYTYDITERKLAEGKLIEGREEISLILNSAAEGIYGVDLKGKCTFCNPSCVSMLGYNDESELMGKHMHALIHHTKPDGTPHPAEECSAWETFISMKVVHSDKEILWRADGTSFPVEFWSHPILRNNTLIGAVVTFIDISERTALEKQLAQAQKMEAVGQLAGGVAHDFNNILSAITGYGYIIQNKLAPDDPMQNDVEQILESANKAAEVTHSLLAFSRNQLLNPRPRDVNDLIRKSAKLLSRLIGEDVEIVIDLANEDLICVVDASQIDQVLMNLTTNARDAMPKGGRFTLSTKSVTVDQTTVNVHVNNKAGLYALISASDTGSGMDQDTASMIFDPFFTTKETDKGTGLGLAVVYGIIKQLNGYIEVKSELGKGTTFLIYLPLTQESKTVIETSSKAVAKGGAETILVAEDDERLRKLYRTILSGQGYNIILANDGDDAIRQFKDNRDKIQLIMLDMIMPKKNGKEVYREMKKLGTNAMFLFASGYADDKIDETILHVDGVNFIAKPVSPKDLLFKVREILDRASAYGQS
jgi:two-component system CheB/CheR fusion protein